MNHFLNTVPDTLIGIGLVFLVIWLFSLMGKTTPKE